MRKKNTVAHAKSPSTPPVVADLNQLLASSYALMANTQFAHWNVEGPAFFALHEAFQMHYENLFAAVDEIAERVRAIDAFTIGGLSNFSKKAGFEELASPRSAVDYVAALIDGHAKVVADAAALRDTAGAANDQETQDIAIGRIQWHEKTIWMLKSFLK
ncbi:MAG: DNA starvation/stationary phase protection protein [Opitutaceae bacterium]|nr:DNA starvation/stationary phase protection protein [Opitutaceae bacterium]